MKKMPYLGIARLSRAVQEGRMFSMVSRVVVEDNHSNDAKYDSITRRVLPVDSFWGTVLWGAVVLGCYGKPSMSLACPLRFRLSQLR